MTSSSASNNGGYFNTGADLSGGIVSAGSGDWEYTATLEPGEYYIEASALTATSGINMAGAMMQTINDSSTTTTKPATATKPSSSSSASASTTTTKPTTATKPSTSTTTSNLKGSWKHNSKGWWYSYTNGTYAKGLQKIDKATYYFDSKGWMKTGWQKISNTWYYFKSSGAMATGWQKVGGSWYYMNSDGKMKTGWATVSNKKYYLNSSGAMATGWKKLSNTWYYFAGSGAMQTGWLKNGGKWYYLGLDGRMLTGLFKNYIDKNNPDSNTYYANSSGAMQTGWQKVSNKWCYFAGSGAMQKSKWIGNYWVGSNGVMATSSWVDNDKYYVDANGKWVKGKTKPATASKPSTSATTTDPLVGRWLMTAISTSGSSGLVPILNPTTRNMLQANANKTYTLRLTSSNKTSTHEGTWKFLNSKNGNRYYEFEYCNVPYWYSSISDGSLVLMDYSDTDNVMCFEKG